MNENSQADVKDHRIDPYEDEIGLMDYLLVIWKWKYLILIGTLVCALIGFISSISTPKTPDRYRIEMLLESGIREIDKNGDKVYIDSAAQIKSLIDGKAFENRILNYMESSNSNNNPISLLYRVSIPKATNLLNISYETQNIDEGIKKLDYLKKALLAEYDKKVNFQRKSYDEELEIKKEKLFALQAEKKKTKTQFIEKIEEDKTLLIQLKNKEKILMKKEEKNLQLKKIKLSELLYEENKLKNQIENYKEILSELDSQANYLNKQREQVETEKSFLPKNVGQYNVEIALLYYQKVHDIINLGNTYRNSIKKYYVLTEDARFNLIKVQNKINLISSEIKNLEKAKNSIKADPTIQPELYDIQKSIIKLTENIKAFEKRMDNPQAVIIFQPSLYEVQIQIKKVQKEIRALENSKNVVQNIQTLRPPLAKKLTSIKQKAKQRIILSTTVGLLLMLFLAFFLEYLYKYKSKKYH